MTQQTFSTHQTPAYPDRGVFVFLAAERTLTGPRANAKGICGVRCPCAIEMRGAFGRSRVHSSWAPGQRLQKSSKEQRIIILDDTAVRYCTISLVYEIVGVLCAWLKLLAILGIILESLYVYDGSAAQLKAHRRVEAKWVGYCRRQNTPLAYGFGDLTTQPWLNRGNDDGAKKRGRIIFVRAVGV
jgi:hypothetical protein